jgi:DNA-binding NarL/FixJ family response regulator/tRNA A-37 threonylcarbamoyl transferase component Bud32
MTENSTSVLIAEDQDIMRLGLRLTLEKIDGVQVVGEAADGEAATKKAMELRPEVVLMDIDLPGMDGIAATHEIKRLLPKTAIIMFTSDSSDQSIFSALGAGADGYCLKNVSADRLGLAINSVVQGAAWLDPAIAQRVLQVNSSRSAQLPQNGAATQSTGSLGNAWSSAGSEPPSDTDSQMEALLDEHEVAVLRLIEDGKNLEQIAQHLHVEPMAIEVKVREILSNFLKSEEPAPEESEADKGVPSFLNIVPSIGHRPGTIIGDRYVIEEQIGSGGMGTVYRARHKLMERIVAIKMLHRQLLTEEKQVSRFYHEAKASGVLNHPNIVTVFDFGVTKEHQPFLVMDFFDGVSLDDEYEKVPFDLQRSIKIFVQVCDALAHAHKRGIVHRDLKPSNIMLINDDEHSDLVKLLDFGVAKIIGDADLNLRLTRTGDLFGTPLYMSPEQCESKPTDARSDIYSLGCVMYEAFTGSVPFVSNSAFQTMNSHVYEQPSRLPFLVPGKKLPPDLEAILFKMLAKDPSHRPQSITEVKNVLARLS